MGKVEKNKEFPLINFFRHFLNLNTDISNTKFQVKEKKNEEK